MLSLMCPEIHLLVILDTVKFTVNINYHTHQIDFNFQIFLITSLLCGWFLSDPSKSGPYIISYILLYHLILWAVSACPVLLCLWGGDLGDWVVRTFPFVPDCLYPAESTNFVCKSYQSPDEYCLRRKRLYRRCCRAGCDHVSCHIQLEID